jgi:hypothetical protein
MAKHIIIMAGIDGLGKTALAGSMCRMCTPIHNKYAQRALLVRLVDNPHKLTRGEALITAARYTTSWDDSRDGTLFVHDRFPVPDEFVYGTGTQVEARTWLKFMTDYLVTFVYVYPRSLWTYMEHMERNPDAHYPTLHRSADAQKILVRYNAFWQLVPSALRVLYYPWQSFHPRHAEDILNFAVKGETSHYGSTERTSVAQICSNHPADTVRVSGS